MASIQNADARRLLRIITSAIKNHRLLTYKLAAVKLGRTPPANHARAVAQMCDLLDAAAALAGVPLLALIAVRVDTMEINPKAWKGNLKRREAIIQNSKRRKFKDSDFKAISRALRRLDGLGNMAAWKFVRSIIPKDNLEHRLTGKTHKMTSDALDDMDSSGDLGSDAPDRAKGSAWSYVRDPTVRSAVKKRANGRCEFCNKLGFMQTNGMRYLECHHIIALAKDGQDRMTNVIALCPDDHRKAHFGVGAEYLEKEMIQKVSRLTR